MKQKIILVVAVFAGILAAVLTTQYFKKKDALLRKQYGTVVAIVASRSLTEGTVIQAEDLGFKTMLANAVGSDYVLKSDFTVLIGKKLKLPVKVNQPILWSYANVQRTRSDTLSSKITEGMRAVSLAISGEAAVSNLVQPDDRVDILGTFSFPSLEMPGEMETVTLTILQDVSVLATGERMSGDAALLDPYSTSRRKNNYSTMTFQVTPREAELLVFAQHVKGNMTLTLRKPNDGGFEPLLPEVDFDHVKDKLEEFNLRRQREVWARDTKDLEKKIQAREVKDQAIRILLENLREASGTESRGR